MLLYNTVTRTRAARYVRFYVVEHTGNPDAHLSMKLIFYGCNTTNDVSGGFVFFLICRSLSRFKFFIFINFNDNFFSNVIYKRVVARKI